MKSKKYAVDAENKQAFFLEVEDRLKKTPLLSIEIGDPSTGKWGMARLWRAWMASTAGYMAANGCVMPLFIKKDGSWYGSRSFSHNDAHDLFTSQWLGVDGSGERISWAKDAGANVADKSQRFHAMRSHQQWMIEKGIKHVNPRDSEYYELLTEHGG